MSTSHYLTVQALTKYIKRKFDADPHLRDVYVMGELSNVKHHPTGHIYFTLKDEKSMIKGMMFKSMAAKLKFKAEDGMKVFIRGDVNVYEDYGTYQIYAQTMEPDGIGGLFVAFNQLKERLHKEGLFNPDFKQKIPALPQTVGVITATSGAAIQDICTTIKRRYPLAEIIVYPTIVQGTQAAPSITENIYLANRQGLCDVLIVGRGGGSIEDLWAFNEEIVARAIFESKIPIISAVGHETDTTIADFVSDLRAPTPTAAAELAVPSQQQLTQHLLQMKQRIHLYVSNQLQHEKTRLSKLGQSYTLATPERLYRPFIERLAVIDSQLQQAAKMALVVNQNKLQTVTASLKQQSPKHMISLQKRHVEMLSNQLGRATVQSIQSNKQSFLSTVRTLEALNPLSIMTKGFTVTYKGEQMVKSVNDVQQDDLITVKYKDGQLEAKVMEVQKEEETHS